MSSPPCSAGPPILDPMTIPEGPDMMCRSVRLASIARSTKVGVEL